MRPTKMWETLPLSALTIAAVLVHGHHAGAEDAAIYLPGVLKHLNPGLFPKNAEFSNRAAIHFRCSGTGNVRTDVARSAQQAAPGSRWAAAMR